MTEGPRLSRPLLDHFELVEGEGRRPGGAAGATECGEVMSCTDEGALSFVTTVCSSYRDSPYKPERGRQNDRRPSCICCLRVKQVYHLVLSSFV